ncbi:MAG: hypothetical protein ACFCUO_03360 [Rhodospirillales bacterium]
MAARRSVGVVVGAAVGAAVAASMVAGCGGDRSRYEAGVSDYDPVYCYRTLGGVSCFDTPRHRDARRLVNYYGPAPGRFDRPPAPPAPRLDPPPAVNYAVMDAVPVPRPAPQGPLDDRPWLLGGIGPVPVGSGPVGPVPVGSGRGATAGAPRPLAAPPVFGTGPGDRAPVE